LLYPVLRRRSPRYAWPAIRRQPLLLLAVVGSKAGTLAEDVLATCEIDSREYAVLEVLSRREGPLPQASIAHEVRRDRTSVMRIARSLAKKGLVLQLADRQDGRVQALAITRRGKETLSLAENNLLAGAEELFSILTAPEVTWILTQLARVL